ncbi:MAG: hypothetical protein ACREOH_20975, partial [Candidatus Entotheonellia bacterium]
KVTEVAAKAAEFANILASELEALNQKYPVAHLEQEAKDSLQRTIPGGVSGPNPEDYKGTFELIFWRYIASRCVIIPE